MVSNDFKVTLARVQLRSGLVTPIVYDTRRPITYIEGSYVINLRERMQKVGQTKFCIEGAWVPELQQENSTSILVKITRLKGITKGELKQVNTVRLWLRVVAMADIANEAGTDIMDNMMSGQWRTGTDLKWPKEYCPRKS